MPGSDRPSLRKPRSPLPAALKVQSVTRYLKAGLLNPYAVLLWRLIAGGLLVYASFDKIRHPILFSIAIRDYRMTPMWAIDPLAWLIPRIELVGGGLLVLGLLTRVAAFVCGGLYAVFVIAIAQALLRGLNIENCGCGITPNEAVSWLLVLRDVALLAMCAIVFLSRASRFTLDRLFVRARAEQSVPETASSGASDQ